MNSNKKIILIIFLILTSIIIYKKYSNRQECNKVVVLSNDEVINCQWVNSYNSGFSNIHTCDGRDIQVYTGDIKSIK